MSESNSLTPRAHSISDCTPYTSADDELHHCPEVMNPPQSAAQGCEAGNLNTGDVMGIGHVHRAAKARPADAVPPALSEADLELAIHAAHARLCAAPTREEKMRHWREMCRLMDRRSIHRLRFLQRLSEYEKEISPPSTSVRIAKASAERSGNAAGGVP